MIFRKPTTKPGKELSEMFAQHLALAIKAAEKVLQELIVENPRHVVEGLAAEVDVLEEQGDELVSEIVKTIAQSSIPITMYGDLNILTDVIDDILDELYFVAQEINRGRRTGLDKNPVVLELYRDLASMMTVAKVAIERLQELVSISFKDMEQAKNLSREIDRLEDRVDEMRNVVIDKIYTLRDRLDPLALYHLIELVKAIDRIVDACKDASHIVMSMVSTIVR